MEKRNQMTGLSRVQGKTVRLGLSKAGARVLIVDGVACAISEYAYEALTATGSMDGIQYFEFLSEDGDWIPCFCRAGGPLQNEKTFHF